MNDFTNNPIPTIQEEILVLKLENEKLEKALDSYKALDSHYDEIEEDAKRISEENEELKKMFEFICKQRFGYAWNMNKDVYIADIKKALKGEKTQWV